MFVFDNDYTNEKNKTNNIAMEIVKIIRGLQYASIFDMPQSNRHILVNVFTDTHNTTNVNFYGKL